MSDSSSTPADILKVFISYSREDMAFADEIFDGLNLIGGFRVTIDRHSIRQGEAWKSRLGALIAASDTIIFILSPASSRSDICQWEVDEAERLGKRIVPVLHQPLDGHPAPRQLAAINYVDFTTARTLVAGIESLAEALRIDLIWLNEATRLLSLALDWHRAERKPNRMLSGDDIPAAKRWLATTPTGAKASVTDLHRDYIRASDEAASAARDEEVKRQRAFAEAQDARAKAEGERAEEARRAEEAARRAEDAARRVMQRTMVGLFVALILAAAAGTAGWFAWQQKQLAQFSRSEALIALASSNQRSGNYLDALASARKAVPSAATALRDSRVVKMVNRTYASLRRSLIHFPLERSFAPTGHGYTATAISKDGSRLATVSRTKALVWDLDTGLVASELPEAPQRTREASFSPGGKYLAAIGRGHVVVWNVESSTVVKRLPNVFLGSGIAFSADGSVLYVTSRVGFIQSWDTITWEKIASTRGPIGPSTSAWNSGDAVHTGVGVMLVPSGKSRSSSELGGIVPENAAFVIDFNSKLDARLDRHTAPVLSVAISHDGKRYLTGSRDTTAVLWDAATKRALASFRGHAGSVTAVAFTFDRRLILTGDEFGQIRVWRPDGSQLGWFEAHRSTISKIIQHPNSSSFISVGYDGVARFWKLGAFKRLQQRPQKKKCGVELSGRSNQIICVVDQEISILEDDVKIASLRNISGSISTIALSFDKSTALTGDAEGTARLWDLANHRALKSTKVFNSGINTIYLNNDASRAILTDGKGGLVNWSIVANTQMRIERPTHFFSHPSDDFKWIAASAVEISSAEFINLDSGVTISRTLPDVDVSGQARMSGDGRLAVVPVSSGVVIVNVGNGNVVGRFGETDMRISSVDINRDGRLILSSGFDRRIRVWDSASGEILLQRGGLTRNRISSRFARDGRSVSVTIRDRRLDWDISHAIDIGSLTPEGLLERVDGLLTAASKTTPRDN